MLHQRKLLLLLLSLAILNRSSAFTSIASSSSASASSTQHQYPRPLHPGGFSLPPLVEDRLPIVASSPASSSPPATDNHDDDNQQPPTTLQTNILLIKPPDMESLWEWFAYTKHQSDSDPSWGRVWPTALSLGRMLLRSLHEVDDGIAVSEGQKTSKEKDLMKQGMHALRTSSHVVEVGCGLGVAGLVYASSVANILSSSSDPSSNDFIARKQRTITFLDREPYALHCVMASASTNGLLTGPLVQPAESMQGEPKNSNIPSVTARAAIDDWTLPTADESSADDSPIKNICYRDLHINTLTDYDNENTILLASDILYEPSSMPSLAKKLKGLLHPSNGGFALIADPAKERTIGCRDSFVDSVHDLGGEVDILPLSNLDGTNNNNQVGLLESDMDIDGSLAKTVLIVVQFGRTTSE